MGFLTSSGFTPTPLFVAISRWIFWGKSVNSYDNILFSHYQVDGEATTLIPSQQVCTCSLFSVSFLSFFILVQNKNQPTYSQIFNLIQDPRSGIPDRFTLNQLPKAAIFSDRFFVISCGTLTPTPGHQYFFQVDLKFDHEGANPIFSGDGNEDRTTFSFINGVVMGDQIYFEKTYNNGEKTLIKYR